MNNMTNEKKKKYNIKKILICIIIFIIFYLIGYTVGYKAYSILNPTGYDIVKGDFENIDESVIDAL